MLDDPLYQQMRQAAIEAATARGVVLHKGNIRCRPGPGGNVTVVQFTFVPKRVAAELVAPAPAQPMKFPGSL